MPMVIAPACMPCESVFGTATAITYTICVSLRPTAAKRSPAFPRRRAHGEAWAPVAHSGVGQRELGWDRGLERQHAVHQAIPVRDDGQRPAGPTDVPTGPSRGVRCAERASDQTTLQYVR